MLEVGVERALARESGYVVVFWRLMWLENWACFGGVNLGILVGCVDVVVIIEGLEVNVVAMIERGLRR